MLTKLSEIAMMEQINLEEGAAKTIVELSKGDMRKVLNVLESCAMAHSSISSQIVYDVTGRPSKEDINELFNSLCKDPFNKQVDLFRQKKTEKSLALEDMLGELHSLIMKTVLQDVMKIAVIKRMAEIEYRLAQGSNEKAQIASLAGIFQEITTSKKPSQQ